MYLEITSWAGARTGFSHELVMYQKSNERAQRASEISDTNNECENSVQAPCPWSNLFISYILSEHFFFLFRKTSLYLEKNDQRIYETRARSNQMP